MLSRIDPRHLIRQNLNRHSGLIVLIICVTVLGYLVLNNFGDEPFHDTVLSKKISARWLTLAYEAGCNPDKVGGLARDSGCDPARLKREDYLWIEKQAPGHLVEALQWAVRRDRIIHGQQ